MESGRWDELERRVAALEAAAGRPAGPGEKDPTAPATFWALEGLRPQAQGSGAVVYAGTFRSEAGEVDWQYAHHVDDLLGAPDAVAGVDEGADRGDLAQVAARLAALGHPARLAILAAVLRGHDRTADLAELLNLGTSGQVYHHVKALTTAGWLRPAARGQVAVPAERVIPLLVAMGVSS
ncbi:ArsR/SmtB family transcription factor [Ornithinimicrobium pratense]|uniref:Winged helix-turn-helix transcriptional regulator n=1 Tax=Ornithinimicrobium pratense TaxID=2593973 RepID=A0A5J6V232_9MICO|nr:winged helix-turn-helix domain-containing protein [Ornithinimicrobium pratense]QFG67919.1 winged helix-turn-helix transcriptional regulator [Ornithinimicrobium pratense]